MSSEENNYRIRYMGETLTIEENEEVAIGSRHVAQRLYQKLV
jgi:hypothetical protein